MEKWVFRWLSCWLYVLSAIGGALGMLLALRFRTWPVHTSLAALSILAPVLHVLEEWRFPGGFFYMYNIRHGASERESDHYPMSPLTDMVTNLVPVLFGCAMLAAGMPYVVSLIWFLLCVMEVVVHTAAGVQMKRRFGAQGKRTIYNPGLATSLLAFLPVAVGYGWMFAAVRRPTPAEAVLAVLCTLIMARLCVHEAEGRLKNRDAPWRFDWGRGYFERFGGEK